MQQWLITISLATGNQLREERRLWLFGESVQEKCNSNRLAVFVWEKIQLFVGMSSGLPLAGKWDRKLAIEGIIFQMAQIYCATTVLIVDPEGCREIS